MRKVQIDTIGSVYNQKNNLFDFLRFTFACMVIYFHSFPLFFGSSKVPDPFTRLVQGQIVLGDVAVDGFLVISGFLITQSILNSRGFISYITKRFLRIFPAFIVATLLMALIVGPIITGLSFYEYFSRGVNTVYRFIFDSLTFNIRGYQMGVKDLFSHNPVPYAINGSAWTLKHEFAMYLILPILLLLSNQVSRFKNIDHKKFIVLTGMAFFVLTVLYYSYSIKIAPISGNKYFWVLGNEYEQFVKLGFYFFYGAILYVYRDKVICNISTIIFACVGLLIANYLHILFYGMLVFMPYLVISLGVTVKFSRFKKYGDFSYGMYIYAFPIQQLIIFLLINKITHNQYVLLSFISTLAVSVLSWYFIEAPCLKQKERIGCLISKGVSLRYGNKKTPKPEPNID